MLFFKKQYIVILLLIWAFNTNAQTNNFFSNIYNLRYHFDKNGQLIRIPFNLSLGEYSYSQIADFKGKAYVYSSCMSDNEISHHHFFKTINNDTIKNGSFFSEKQHYYNFSTFLDTNKIIFLGQILAQNNSNLNLAYSIISPCPTHKSGLELKEVNKNIEIKFNQNIEGITWCRNKFSNPVLVVKTTNYFYSYFFNNLNLKFELKDSLYFEVRSDLPDSIKFNPFYEFNTTSFTQIINLSNNGDKLVFDDQSSMRVKKSYYFKTLSYQTNAIKILDFDKETGKFSNLKTVELFRSKNMNEKYFYDYFKNFCFSPNDSFLYYTITENDSATGHYKTDKIIQYDLINNLKKIIYSKNYDLNLNNISLINANFNLNHLGQIFYVNNKLSNNDWTMCLINNPNENYNKIKFEWDKWNIFNSQFSNNFNINNNLYDYLRTDHTITYDCKATVTIKNNSQPWIGFTDFKWHILNDKGKEEYYNTKEPPTLTYTQNGDYYIKLFGYSPRGKGYGEWYIDTIKVRIPTKPVADFFAKDSIVCRYTGCSFKNHSNAQDSIKNQYLWTFGDGSTSRENNPTHIYTQAGVYTVSLHYKNGYCDSTLTKNQYIRVVDAPKPGFSVNTQQGCAPLSIIFSDTSTRNVQQKDYWFSDINTWRNVPIQDKTFNHTFLKAGKYKALQRLTGYSGCVIQTDSVFFNISKGLTKQDTLHLEKASIETTITPQLTGKAKLYNLVPGFAHLNWQKQDGATNYQIYKDGSPYFQTKDSFYTDPRPYITDVNYTIAGIDSCGNVGSAGRLGKPIFLKGSLQGQNEASLIQYTSYLNPIENPNYTIEKLTETSNGSQWQAIAQQSSPQPYTDNNILQTQDLQACYRIVANIQNMPFSISNVVCVPFLPIIFVPTSFSPNDDGINDTYDPKAYGLQKFNLTVFNRWGEQVFAGSNNEAWLGESSPEGVYLVEIEYVLNNGVKQTQRTTVTLLR